MIGMQSEIRASLALSVVDTMRQRGLSAEDVAALANVEAGQVGALVECRDVSGQPRPQ